MSKWWLRVCLALFICVGAVSAQQGPTTPVPPVPTYIQQRLVYEQWIRQAEAQIASLNADLHVYQFLLENTPATSPNYTILQNTIRDLQSQITRMEAYIAWVRLMIEAMEG